MFVYERCALGCGSGLIFDRVPSRIDEFGLMCGQSGWELSAVAVYTFQYLVLDLTVRLLLFIGTINSARVSFGSVSIKIVMQVV